MTDYPEENTMRCPECPGIIGIDMSEMAWEHTGPHSADCPIQTEEPLAHYDLMNKYILPKFAEIEEQENAKANPNASQEQFGQVVNVDFKNKKRLD